MIALRKSTALTVGAAVLAGAVLAACARDDAAYHGSIKDSRPSASATPATPRSATAASPKRSAGRSPAAPAGDEEALALALSPQRSQESAAPVATASAASVQSPAPPTKATPPGATPAGDGAKSAEKPDRAAVPANALLIEQGRNFFVAGKVLEARKRFIAALNGMSPDATLALARTFDTYYLSRLAASDGAPDMQRAVQLYESAVERGSVDARIDLERTRATLGLPPL